MFTYVDVMYARTRYEEMLREAEEARRFAHVRSQTPGTLRRVFTALRSALMPQRAQPAQPQTAAMRKSMATE